MQDGYYEPDSVISAPMCFSLDFESMFSNDYLIHARVFDHLRLSIDNKDKEKELTFYCSYLEETQRALCKHISKKSFLTLEFFEEGPLAMRNLVNDPAIPVEYAFSKQAYDFFPNPTDYQKLSSFLPVVYYYKEHKNYICSDKILDDE